MNFHTDYFMNWQKNYYWKTTVRCRFCCTLLLVRFHVITHPPEPLTQVITSEESLKGFSVTWKLTANHGAISCRLPFLLRKMLLFPLFLRIYCMILQWLPRKTGNHHSPRLLRQHRSSRKEGVKWGVNVKRPLFDLTRLKINFYFPSLLRFNMAL